MWGQLVSIRLVAYSNAGGKLREAMLFRAGEHRSSLAATGRIAD